MLTSNIEDLRERGYIEQYDLSKYRNLDKEQLIELLNDKVAINRSSAARVISMKYGLNDAELAKIFLEQLVKEKKLYTRLELCSALEKGNEVTAKEMTYYIGRMGNHHKVLPQRPSLKKSFPLPRDMIARSLGRMSPRIMPVLNDVLDSGDVDIISEVLDAIGYLTFYNEVAATKNNLNKVLETVEKYKDNPVVLWKCIICLSGFPLTDCVKFLTKFINENSNSLYVEEAKRSLKLMEKKRFHQR
jgi:hypothetical protein